MRFKIKYYKYIQPIRKKKPCKKLGIKYFLSTSKALSFVIFDNNVVNRTENLNILKTILAHFLFQSKYNIK